MAPRTIKAALADALANLSEKDLKKFVHKLLDRRDEPRVPRNRVDGKDHLDIVDVLVGTFTEERALRVTVDILEEIGCRDVAKDLRADTAALVSPPANMSDPRHFVDTHRAALIQRINNIDQILDQLLGSVIQKEVYDKIRAKETKQDQMRELYKSLEAGTKAKDQFYRLLQVYEEYLVDELNEA